MTRVDVAALLKRVDAILALPVEVRPYFHAVPEDVRAVLVSLQEAHKGLRRIELAQDCEHCVTIVRVTLDGIAEKVDLCQTQ